MLLPAMGNDSRTRRYAIKAIGSASAIGFAGCSGGKSNDSADAESKGNGAAQTEDNENTQALKTITTYTGGGRAKAYKQIAEKFTEKTGIEVKHNALGASQYRSVLPSALGTDNSPDLFYGYPDLSRGGKYVSQGVVTPVEGHFDTSKLRIDKWPESTLNTCRYEEGDMFSWQSSDGKLYAIPHVQAGFMIYYNKAVLKEAGIDPEGLRHSKDITWSDFLQMCKDVKNETGKTPIYSGNSAKWPALVILTNLVGSAVGSETYGRLGRSEGTSKLDSEPIIEALSRFKHLAQEYMNQDANSLKRGAAATQFFNDQSAFFNGTSGFVSQQVSANAPDDFEVPRDADYFWWPYFPDMNEGGKEEAMTLTSSWFMSNQIDNRGTTEEASEYLNHFFSDWAMKKRITVGNMGVPRPDLWEEISPDYPTKIVQDALTEMGNLEGVYPPLDYVFVPKVAEQWRLIGENLIAGGDPKKEAEKIKKIQKEALPKWTN